MKKSFLTAVLVIASLFAFPAKAQVQTVAAATSNAAQAVAAQVYNKSTFTIDASVGAGSIGYNPDVNFGISYTKPIGKRLELYTQVTASPLSKTGYVGYTLNGDGRVIVWATPRIGTFVGVRPSYVTFGGTQKHAFNGLAGFALRDHWISQMPGRLYLAYEQEIGGCVWATPSNPCPLTSAKFIGGRVEQDFRMTSRIRFGIAIATGRVNQQINPNAPQAGAIYGIATQVDLTFRFTPKKQSTDPY